MKIINLPIHTQGIISELTVPIAKTTGTLRSDFLTVFSATYKQRLKTRILCSDFKIWRISVFL